MLFAFVVTHTLETVNFFFLFLSSMAKKKQSSSSAFQQLFSLLISLLLILFFLAFLRLHSYYYHSTSVSPPLNRPFSHQFSPPKIAFLFIARENLPLDFIWHNFFKNGDLLKFSIYVHSSPGFVFDKTTTMSAFFRDRQLKKSIKVAWGEPNMIEAERLLLETALQNPTNQRFVFLSENCVPLYNFTYIYSYLMSSPKSFVDSFLDDKEDRYNPKMSPQIPKKIWRKGSQWVTLIRRHAKVVVKDEIVFTAFLKYCMVCMESNGCRYKSEMRLRSFTALSHVRKNYLVERMKWPNCIADEHYVQTLLMMSGLEAEIERRTLTYCSWNHTAKRRDPKSWHPFMFQYEDAGKNQIQKIKSIEHISYKPGDRTQWCRANSTSAPCFLFARKFSIKAAMRILTAGVVGPYNATNLLD